MQQNTAKFVFSLTEQKKLESLSSQEYCLFSGINEFLKDYSINFLKNYSESTNKTINENLNEYIIDYLKGEYVLLKSFATITLNNQNRICFISNFLTVFNLWNFVTNQITCNSEKSYYNGYDIFQMLKLICKDFPKSIFLEMLKNTIQDAKTDNNEEILEKKLDIKCFINSFFLNFLYSEFLEETRKILQNDKSISNYLKIISKLYKSRFQNIKLLPFGLILSILNLNNEVNDNFIMVKSNDHTSKLFENINFMGLITFNDFIFKILQNKNFEWIMIRELKEFQNLEPKQEIIDAFNILVNEEEFDSESDGE